MSVAERWQGHNSKAFCMNAEVSAADFDRMEFTPAERALVDNGFVKDAPVSTWLLSFSIMFRVLERMAGQRGA